MRLIALLLLLLEVMPLMSQEVTDSVTTEVAPQADYTFQPKQLILPVSLITVGAVGLSGGFVQDFKENVRDKMLDLSGKKRFRADDYIQYLPVITNVALGFGVKARHSFKERVAVTATAYLALGIMVNVPKWLISERRPDSSARNSFPSGHSATAFMGAELMRVEYGKWWGLGAYTIATGVAFLRLYNNRHWINDVVAGAGIGILSARIGYWLLPLERKWFKWRPNSDVSAVALPVYDPFTRSASLAVSISL